MDNDPAMLDSCVNVAVLSGIGLLIWLGWMAIDWVVGELEYRREMKKMKGREER